MQSKSEAGADQTPQANAGNAEPVRWDARRSIIRIVVSLVLFFAFMATLAKLAGPRIEAAGQVFVDKFGLAGLALGTIAADAFSLPPPPLFYIVIVATGTESHLVGMTVISFASMGAGVLGYHMASLLSARPFFRRRIDATRARMDKLFERYGVWAFAIASATPLPFSLMCYVAGVYKVKPKLLALVVLFRVPRLLVMYWLVRAGWMTGSG
ncbi:MAG: VTT domain-containing protein [Polyangiaceae bacterium]|nr:VTT domain-containing protein [Polyangiaceae bacterium]